MKDTKGLIFSKIVAKLSVDVVHHFTTDARLKRRFEGIISGMTGVEVCVDGKNFWYVVGSWDDVHEARERIYQLLSSLDPPIKLSFTPLKATKPIPLGHPNSSSNFREVEAANASTINYAEPDNDASS